MTIQVLLGMSLSKGDESLPTKFVKRNTISMFSISQLMFLIFLIKKKIETHLPDSMKALIPLMFNAILESRF